MSTATIIVRDEVNCKITGLELQHRKALSKRFEYEIPGARYLPAVRLGRWNGKVPYFQLGGTTYVNLLTDIIPLLEEWGYHVELEDIRDYDSVVTFNRVDAMTFSNRQWPVGHPGAGQPIVLRDYQVDVINNFLENSQSVQSVATGAGKTLITAALSWSCQDSGRTIVVVPSKSLVSQTESDYRNLGLDVGVYYGDRKEWNHRHTICTWQSLNTLLKNTKDGVADDTILDFIDGVVCIMIDECHSAKADALKSLLTGVMSKIPVRWGLTGTIPKEQFASQALYVSLGPVVNHLSASELQDMGVLAQCHVSIKQLQDSKEFSNYQSELKFLLEDERRLDKMSSMIENISSSGNTLVLVDRVNAGRELVDRLESAVFVSGDTKVEDRKQEYDEVSTSTSKIIIATYGVAAVGINIPRIFNLVLIEPGKSFVRVIQSIGRGIRKAEDKDFVQIWDITSSCKFAKRHLTKRKEFYREANYPFSIDKLSY